MPLTYEEMIEDLRDKQDLTRTAILRTIQLFVENEKLEKEIEELKKELKSRRHQADVWRLMYQQLLERKR